MVALERETPPAPRHDEVRWLALLIRDGLLLIVRGVQRRRRESAPLNGEALRLALIVSEGLHQISANIEREWGVSKQSSPNDRC